MTQQQRYRYYSALQSKKASVFRFGVLEALTDLQLRLAAQALNLDVEESPVETAGCRRRLRSKRRRRPRQALRIGRRLRWHCGSGTDDPADLAYHGRPCNGGRPLMPLHKAWKEAVRR